MAARRGRRGGARPRRERGGVDGKRRGALLLGVLLAGVIGYALIGGRSDDGPPPIVATAYLDGIGEGRCAGILNTYECAAAIERVVLPALGAQARRVNGTLVLQLAGGDSVALVDPVGDDIDDEPAYHLVGRLPSGYYVVHGQYYEGDFYLLVSERTGEEQRLWDRPLVSPDDARLLVASADITAGYKENGFQIWQRHGARLALEWSIQPEEWGPLDAAWIDAETIRFTKEGWCDDGTGFCRTPAVLELSDGRWQVRDTGPRRPVTND